MILQCPIAAILASRDLIDEYAAECSIPEIGDINPQAEIYEVMEKSGLMSCFMAFDGGVKVGFAILLAVVFPHYGKKVGTVESLFVGKEHRESGAGRTLMFHVEQFAKEIGCVGILYSAPIGGQLERLLDASKGYKRTNAVFLRSFA